MNAANMPQPSNPVQSKAWPSRIVFVRQQFTPFGGGELVLDRTLTALAARGFQIALLGRSWTGRSDIEFIRCDPSRFPRILRESRFAHAACELLRRESNALVQAHDRIPCCDIFRAGDGAHAAFLEHRARGSSPLARAALYLHPYHRSVLALERRMFASPRLKAVLVNSSMVGEEIVRHFGYPGERIHLVPNGIDLDRFKLAARERHRGEIRRRLGTGERPVALFVGSGYKRKGLDTAIVALAASRVDAELWVVGNDRHPGRYATLAARAGLPEGRLRLLGAMPDPLPYYAGADVLVLPSVYDPFPSTVLEALACGLPVVTSASCGARDLIKRLDPALVRDARDETGLAEAVRRAFDLAARPATLQTATALAQEYGIESMIERTLSVYGRLQAVSAAVAP